MKKIPGASMFFLCGCMLAAASIFGLPEKASTQQVQCGSGVVNECGATCTQTHWWYGCTQWRYDYDRISDNKEDDDGGEDPNPI